MLTFKLTRQFATPFVTTGVLTEETSKFRCATVEKITPSDAIVQNKSFLALPEGVYRMKLKLTEDLLFTLSIEAHGAYRNACICGAAKPSLAPAGCICIGKRWMGTEMQGGEQAAELLSNLIDHLVDTGVLNSKGKYGEVLLEISEEEMMRTEGADPDDDGMGEENLRWDLLDETEDEEDGIEDYDG